MFSETARARYPVAGKPKQRKRTSSAHGATEQGRTRSFPFDSILTRRIHGTGIFTCIYHKKATIDVGFVSVIKRRLHITTLGFYLDGFERKSWFLARLGSSRSFMVLKMIRFRRNLLLVVSLQTYYMFIGSIFSFQRCNWWLEWTLAGALLHPEKSRLLHIDTVSRDHTFWSPAINDQSWTCHEEKLITTVSSLTHSTPTFVWYSFISICTQTIPTS